jgi:hypothetical protein
MAQRCPEQKFLRDPAVTSRDWTSQAITELLD